jgi:hypothetical protein
MGKRRNGGLNAMPAPALWGTKVGEESMDASSGTPAFFRRGYCAHKVMGTPVGVSLG